MTHAEGEWAYLHSNITAQQLGDAPAVQQSLARAHHLEEVQLQELFHANAHQAVGLDQDGLAVLAKKWQLEAAAGCLPKKVALVREAVATATGHADGAALAASPGYDPAPRISGGWLAWSRFDLGNQAEAAAKAWKGKSLVHSVTGGNVAALLSTGVLASTERRAVMGISSGKGLSESDDKYSGGANSVFMRVRKQGPVKGGSFLVWDDPLRIVDNTSVYGYNSDHFGSLNPKSGKSTVGMTKDPMKMAKFTGSSNEVMVRHGLDLFGAEAPSRIICTSAAERKKVLDLLESRSITHLAGKPVGQVVELA
jgi:hypothetical protein